jgi:hypothetical protein
MQLINICQYAIEIIYKYSNVQSSAIPRYLCDLEKVYGTWITAVWTDKERGNLKLDCAQEM